MCISVWRLAPIGHSREKAVEASGVDCTEPGAEGPSPRRHTLPYKGEGNLLEDRRSQADFTIIIISLL